MLSYAILGCTILYYTILYYTILYYTIPCYDILYYTILYYTILYYTTRLRLAGIQDDVEKQYSTRVKHDIESMLPKRWHHSVERMSDMLARDDERPQPDGWLAKRVESPTFDSFSMVVTVAYAILTWYYITLHYMAYYNVLY